MINLKHNTSKGSDAYLAAIARLRRAALDQEPIAGLTHRFYRYPARFSPRFVRAAIEVFSSPGDLVLDPYMGGGTTIVEAYTAGRRCIGNDVNSLAVFVAAAKLTTLREAEQTALMNWAYDSVPKLRCNVAVPSRYQEGARRPSNMSLPRVRWLRKTIEQCLATMEAELTTDRAKQFARCIVLSVGEWALNGRRRIPRVREFRERVAVAATEMLEGMNELREALDANQLETFEPRLVAGDAEELALNQKVKEAGLADLVITSPPYPGIHILYHRWQVDGRKESDAPYWITAADDGAGSAFYTFADHRREAEHRYFDKAERAFSAVRSVTRDGALLVQLIAFADPQRQIRRYLGMMERAGFRELRRIRERRTWRAVPNRRWHASVKGDLPSSREVTLVHRAV